MKVVVAGIDTLCECDIRTYGSQLALQGGFRQIAFVSTEDTETIEVPSSHVIQVVNIVVLTVANEMVDTATVGAECALS